MKRIILLIAIAIMACSSAMTLDIDKLFSSVLGTIPRIVSIVSSESGSVSYRKTIGYIEFTIEGSGFKARILSFPMEQKEMVWLNSSSLSLPLSADIRIGSRQTDVLAILGTPTYSKTVSDGVELDFYGKQYMLMLKFSDGLLKEFFYNPFE